MITDANDGGVIITQESYSSHLLHAFYCAALSLCAAGRVGSFVDPAHIIWLFLAPKLHLSHCSVESAHTWISLSYLFICQLHSVFEFSCFPLLCVTAGIDQTWLSKMMIVIHTKLFSDPLSSSCQSSIPTLPLKCPPVSQHNHMERGLMGSPHLSTINMECIYSLVQTAWKCVCNGTMPPPQWRGGNPVVILGRNKLCCHAGWHFSL